MKIIGAGFPRTGTFSTKHALEELGFDPCYPHGGCAEESSTRLFMASGYGWRAIRLVSYLW